MLVEVSRSDWLQRRIGRRPRQHGGVAIEIADLGIDVRENSVRSVRQRARREGRIVVWTSRNRSLRARIDDFEREWIEWLRCGFTWTIATARTKPPVEIPRQAGEAEWSVERVQVDFYELRTNDAAKTEA